MRVSNVLPSILIMVALCHSSTIGAFSIGPTPADFGGEVHQNITRQALSGIVITSKFARSTFTEAAIKEIVSANVKIDEHQDRPTWHCDNNDLNGCSQVIGDLKQQIIDALRRPTPVTLAEQQANAKASRKSLGEALHTLQDFYAHSNWVENNSTIAAFLGNSSLLRFDATGVTRNCDPNTSTLSTSRLISEYAITIISFLDLQSAWAPRFECAHGFNGNGIHKDWDGRANFSKAYQLAYVASVDFIKQQVLSQATNAQSVCAMLGGDLECASQSLQLDYPGATFTQLWDINQFGTLVGGAEVGGKLIGFAYSNGVFTAIHEPFPSTSFVAAGITDTGNVVGTWCRIGNCIISDLSLNSGVLLTIGISTPFAVPGAIQTDIRGVSSNGRYIAGDRFVRNPSGVSTFLGWVYDATNKKFSLIGGENDNTVVAQGVNNSGQVVGSGVFFPSTAREGFIYDTNTGTRTKVSVPGFPDRSVVPRAINDVGQVAGAIEPTSKVFFGIAGNFRTVDIAGGTAAYIYGNNNAGNFVGFYVDAGGRYHGFVLSNAAAP